MNGCDVCGKEDLLGYQLKVVCEDCAAKIVVAVNSASTNTASKKFPSSTDVWNSVIDHYMDVGLPGTVEQARSVSKVVYDFLRRKLLA